MISSFAECNRLPFDLPEAEQELVGGYHTEYNAMKLAFFFLGEYTHMITTSFLMVILFFGGWHLPVDRRGRFAVGLEAGRVRRQGDAVHPVLHARSLDDPAFSLRSVHGPGVEGAHSAGPGEPGVRDGGEGDWIGALWLVPI